MNNTPDPNWTVVAECNSVPEASIIAGAIENEGIPTTILNSALQSALPMTFTWAPVQVAVPKIYKEKAQELVPDDMRAW